MYTNKCTKCGAEFETKNPKRVICPGCLYPDKKDLSLQTYSNTLKEPPAEPEQRPDQGDRGGRKPPGYFVAGESRDQGYQRDNRDQGYNRRPNYQQDRGGYRQDNYRQDRSGGFNRSRPPQQRPNYQQDRGGYRQDNYRQDNYRQDRSGGFNRSRPPQQRQGGPGGFRRPQGNQRVPGRGGFDNRRRPAAANKKLLISREQVSEIENLYREMLPLPNPDCHEVIGEKIQLEPNKVFFGINLVRQKMKLPKLPFPKRKLAVSTDQLMAVKNLYEPLLPLPPIGCHKIIAKQLKMDEWRVHVGIGIIRKQMDLPRWNPDREDAPAEFKNQQPPAEESKPKKPASKAKKAKETEEKAEDPEEAKEAEVKETKTKTRGRPKKKEAEETEE